MGFAGFTGWVGDQFDMVWAAGGGGVDGMAMMLNAITFHQIDSLDSYVDGAIEDNGGRWSLYGIADISGHVGVYLGGTLVAYAMAFGSTFTIVVGEGAPFHVIYQAGSNTPWLHAMGSQFFRMRVTTLTGERLTEFLATRYISAQLPILFPAAAGGLAGQRAYSCVTAAMHAFFRGWVPFLP
jgi:hypothetical protein